MEQLDLNKIVITNFPDGAENAHGTSAHNGVLWCGTRQVPGHILCYDAATMSLIDHLIFPSHALDDDELYPGVEQIVCHRKTGMMYANCHGDMLRSIRVVEMWLDEGEIQWRDVISEEWNFYDEPQLPTLAVIEIDQERGVLYAGMWDDRDGASIRSYSLTDRDGDGLLVLLEDYHIESNASILWGIHSLVSEGEHLYVTSQMRPAWIAKIKVSGETMSTEDFFYFPTGFNTITDDSCYCEGYLFCGFETPPHQGTVVRINANDLSDYQHIEFPYGAPCYGVYNVDGIVYALHFRERPIISVIDPHTLSVTTFTSNDINASPNELASLSGMLYMPTWLVYGIPGDSVILSCPIIRPVDSNVRDIEFELIVDYVRVSWSGNAPQYRVEVSNNDAFLPGDIYEVNESKILLPANWGNELHVKITPLDGAVVGGATLAPVFHVPPMLKDLSLGDAGAAIVGISFASMIPVSFALITMQSGLVSYTFVAEFVVAQTIHEALLPNMFPGEETTITLAVGDQTTSTTFMAAEVARDVLESSGITRLTEDKQSIVYARGSGAYAILTTSSGYNNKYGVLAFVINEDNEIVLNDSMTSDYLYSDLSVSGDKPFLLNDETPFGVNLKYAWRGSNTDALEICVKLCLQGE